LVYSRIGAPSEPQQRFGRTSRFTAAIRSGADAVSQQQQQPIGRASAPTSAAPSPAPSPLPSPMAGPMDHNNAFAPNSSGSHPMLAQFDEQNDEPEQQQYQQPQQAQQHYAAEPVAPMMQQGGGMSAEHLQQLEQHGSIIAHISVSFGCGAH
jgi:hypothetical protein